VSLSAAELTAVIAELQPLRGSRVDAVRFHAGRALTLALRGPAGAATLLVSAEPELTRIHVARERPPAPAWPAQLQALLERELEGARLVSIAARAGDRVVELLFAPRERSEREAEPPASGRPRGRLRLVAELIGRHGNLFLVGEDGLIRASAVPSPSARRRLAPGSPYEPPAPAPEPGPAASRFAPAPGADFPLSAAVEAFYLEAEEERLLAEGRRRLREPLRAAAARARRALSRLADEAARVPAAEGDRRTADLLKQNLSALRRGQTRAVLTEWTAEGPREVAVALDPELSPRENMERAYRRWRRIADSGARVARRAAEVQERLARLEALLSAVTLARRAELSRLEREARRLGAAPPPLAAPGPGRAREAERLPYRAFRSLAGVPILVGRGPEENDELTVRLARGNDLWLHARGRGGAHVVARLARGAEPDQEVLLDAAHLAAWFSGARGEPSVEVAWTRAKHVRKPKGAPPGAVHYSQERTLSLRIEPERLERLLASEGAGEAP
jgi:predicted ribosome quality control (RQC) complex YloA/Tae2 family protein